MWEAEKGSNQGVIYSGEIFPYSGVFMLVGRSAPLSDIFGRGGGGGEREEKGRGRYPRVSNGIHLGKKFCTSPGGTFTG